MAEQTLATALADLLKSTNGLIAQVVLALGGLLGVVKGVLAFQDDLRRKRPLEHHKRLADLAPPGGAAAEFLANLACVEVCRQTFGVSTSTTIANELFALFNRGRFSMPQLRAAARYSELAESRLVFRPGWSCWISLVSGVLMAAGVLYIGAVLFLALFRVHTLEAFGYALLVEATTLAIVGVIGMGAVREGASLYVASQLHRPHDSATDHEPIAPAQSCARLLPVKEARQ